MKAPGTTPDSSATDRQRALRHSALVNHLKALTRQQLGVWLGAVVKRCMDPSTHLDLKRTDLQLRMEAMDSLFANRASLTQRCIDVVVAGLEAPTTYSARHREEQSLSREDAELALAGAPFSHEQDKRHQTVLNALALRINALAITLGRVLDPYCLHPQALFESFRLQVRGLDLPTAGKLVLCELFWKELPADLGRFYAAANDLLLKGDILAEASADAVDSAPARVRDAHLFDAVRQVAPLFAGIERFPDYSEQARAALLALRPPLVQLAYAEGAAFRDPEHPAKRLLTSLAQRFKGLMDPDETRHRDLMNVIEALLASSKASVTLFGEAIRKNA